MNYAFHIDLGEMSYDKWHAMYSAPENKAKRADWWGPEFNLHGITISSAFSVVRVLKRPSP